MNIATTIVIAVFILAGVYLFGYNGGVASIEKEIRDANEKHLAEMLQQKLELVNLNKQLETKTHERITIIKRVIDPTGCIDSPVPDAVIDSLQ